VTKASPSALPGMHRRVPGVANASCNTTGNQQRAGEASSWATRDPQWVALPQEAPGRLADEYVLLAYDERGVPLVVEGVVQLGAAAALLAEQLLASQLIIEHGVVVVCGAVPPADVIARTMRDTLTRDGQEHTVRELLSYFAEGALAQIAGRLPERLRVDHRRRTPLRPERWVPRDKNAGATIGVILVDKLAHPEKAIATRQIVLAGLARVTGLERFHMALAEVSDRPELGDRLEYALRAALAAARAAVRAGGRSWCCRVAWAPLITALRFL
jgi:hypothetical protein